MTTDKKGRFVSDSTVREFPGVGLLGAYVVGNFWSWYRDTGSGCWEWTKSFNNMGYGQQRVHGGRTLTAHRIAYALYHGSIPDGLQVLHRCDNPKCVNPDHLFVGTTADNMNDALEKGRRGGNYGGGGTPMFTDAQAEEIRTAEGSQRALAKRFGVAQNVIGRIKRGTYRTRPA